MNLNVWSASQIPAAFDFWQTAATSQMLRNTDSVSWKRQKKQKNYPCDQSEGMTWFLLHDGSSVLVLWWELSIFSQMNDKLTWSNTWDLLRLQLLWIVYRRLFKSPCFLQQLTSEDSVARTTPYLFRMKGDSNCQQFITTFYSNPFFKGPKTNFRRPSDDENKTKSSLLLGPSSCFCLYMPPYVYPRVSCAK